MQENIIQDFSAGWCPSDNAVGGRKNALLRMESLELDSNGAVVMCGGTKRLKGPFTNTLHTINTKFLIAQQYYYSADINGGVFRDTTSIGSGGSTTRAAFCNAYDYVLAFSGNTRKRDDGSTATDIGQTASSAPVVATNGAGVLTGDYEYIQINVFVGGSYKARSAPSPKATVVANANKIQITANNPTAPANEVWIFRRGGDLDQFYRVKRLTSSYNTPFDDNVSDEDALNEGVVANLLAVPTNSMSLPDPILEIVGPFNGRFLLFTKNAVYATELNSPESYVPGQGNFFMGSATTAEIFLWALKIGNGVILIGTSHDIYRLTGSFVEFPDGTLDMTVRPLGVDAPPISIDVTKYQGAVCYMSAYGWVLCDINGAIQQLCSPNTDRIYRGNTCYTIGGVPIYLLPQLRYSCAAARNKLFVRVPQIVDNNPALPFTYRMEVYDFIRQYWRVITFPSNHNPPEMLFAQEDDAVIGFFNDDKYIKEVDHQFAKTLEAATTQNQTVNFLTTFLDLDSPRRRKDGFNLIFTIDTGGSNLTYNIFADGNETSAVFSGTLNSNGLGELFVTTAGFFFRTLQILLTGQVANFKLAGINVVSEARPPQTTYVNLISTNFGITSKKRVRTLSVVLDCRGGSVTFVPYVDEVSFPSTVFTGTGIRTYYYYFVTDVFGTDYRATFNSSTPFELFSGLIPVIVHQLPTPKRFDQIGSYELFRYGKVKAFEFRLLAIGGTTIPYTVYFEDTTEVTGNITVADGKEDVYTIDVPKTTAGSIIRVTLGPTAFDFYRITGRVKFIASGRDSENKWVEFSQLEAQETPA